MAFDRSRAVRALDKVTLALAELRMILAAEDEAPADPQAEMIERLRQACHEKGIDVSVDGHVREPDAGRLLGRSASTLRNWRSTHDPIPHRTFLGRVEYALADVADFIAENSPNDAE